MSDHPRGQPHPPQHTPPKHGGSPASNPDGRTPHGVPDQADAHEPTGTPDSDRHRTETTPGKH